MSSPTTNDNNDHNNEYKDDEKNNDDNESKNHNTIIMSNLREQHLQWTATQGHILTGGGMAEQFYNEQHGYTFTKDELPHYHLECNNTHKIFREWIKIKYPCELVTGCWNRPLFVGGWKHSTDKDEHVYNIQTHNLFVDLRIPKSRNVLLKHATSLDDLTAQELCIYARQHVFAGYTVYNKEKKNHSVRDTEKEFPLCTRHHCIDWNYVGIPRSRPNKWWIKVNNDNDNNNNDNPHDKKPWKEYSYASDDEGQHYYFERWEHHPTTFSEPRLAFRKASHHSDSVGGSRDGVLVIVGNHFNYVLGRVLSGQESNATHTSLVDLVDAMVGAGDLTAARAYLSIEAGHGTVMTRSQSSWKLDCAIPPWNEGQELWQSDKPKFREGDTIDDCGFIWKGEKWDIYDCSFNKVEELREYIIKNI